MCKSHFFPLFFSIRIVTMMLLSPSNFKTEKTCLNYKVQNSESICLFLKLHLGSTNVVIRAVSKEVSLF